MRINTYATTGAGNRSHKPVRTHFVLQPRRSVSIRYRMGAVISRRHTARLATTRSRTVNIAQVVLATTDCLSQSACRTRKRTGWSSNCGGRRITIADGTGTENRTVL